MAETENTEELQESSGGKSAGAMLREAREAAKLSVEEVATELHLVSDVVTALENGDRSKLPSRVFTLGYLRNYAKLVNLPYEQVRTAFEDFNDEQVPILNQPRAPQIPKQAKGGGWLIKALGWMVLFAFLLLAYLWWKGEVAIPGLDLEFPLAERQLSSPGEMPAGAEPSPAGIALDPATNQQILLPPAENTETPDPASDTNPAPQQPAVITRKPAAEATEVIESSQQARQAPVGTVAEVSVPAGTDETTAESGTGMPDEAIGIPLETAIEKPPGLERLDRIADVSDNNPAIGSDVRANTTDAASPESTQQSIRISFSESCWVQVTDSTGKLVLNGEMRAGDTRDLDGEAPFRFVLGNASAVELLVGNKLFDLEPYTSGNVARFTLEAREG